MDRNTQFSSWTAVNQSSTHNIDRAFPPEVESNKTDSFHEVDESVSDNLSRARKRRRTSTKDAIKTPTQSVQSGTEADTVTVASQLSTPPPTIKRVRKATYSRKFKPFENPNATKIPILTTKQYDIDKNRPSLNHPWTTTEEAVKVVQYGLTKTTLDKLSEFKHNSKSKPQTDVLQSSATVKHAAHQSIAHNTNDNVESSSLIITPDLLCPPTMEDAECITRRNHFTTSLPGGHISSHSNSSNDIINSIATNENFLQGGSMFLSVYKSALRDSYGTLEFGDDEILAIDDHSLRTDDCTLSTKTCPTHEADPNDEFPLDDITGDDFDAIPLLNESNRNKFILPTTDVPFSSKDVSRDVQINSLLQHSAIERMSSASPDAQVVRACSTNANRKHPTIDRYNSASSVQITEAEFHSSPNTAQATFEAVHCSPLSISSMKERRKHFLGDNDDDFSQLLPFARPDFPSRIRDRSSIIGVTPSRILRTCFRIGEAYREASLCEAQKQDAIFELYARVVSSSREPATFKQHFQFADLFHDRPPHPIGLLENYKSSALQDTEGRRLIGDDGVGRMVRCLGRLKRESKERGWSFQISNVRSTDWEEIGWTKRTLELN